MGSCLTGDGGSAAEEAAKETKLESQELSSLNWTKEKKLKLQKGSSFGAPFIHNERISFLTSLEDSLGLISYDIKTNEWLENASVNCEAGSLDINNCVYSFNAESNTLYFIHDSAQVFSLDLATNTLKSIATVAASGDNQVLIHTLKGKVYILGDEEENKSNDDFIYVPYDENTKGIGDRSVLESVTLKGKDYIFIMGGIKAYTRGKQEAEADGPKAPHDEIWILDVEEKTWERQHMSRSIAACGIINYENTYLLAFGGLGVDKNQKIKDSKEINALDIDKGEWFRFKAKLPNKGRYFAVHPQGSKTVRLFSWNGKHSTAQIEDIARNTTTEELRFRVSTWNEMGKTVLPTNSSVKSMGPKMDEDSDSD